MLKTQQASKAFGGLQAVASVDLEVARGRVTGVIGPNGAGKSTLMNIISGFIAPDLGEITVDVESIAGQLPHQVCRHGVARTFQNLQMFSDMSVLEVVITGCHRHLTVPVWASLLMLPAARREESKAVEQAKELLIRLDVDRSYWQRRAGDLPYGLQRRVEIARALATGPGYLLLDEPAAGLNNEETTALGRTLRELAVDDLGIALIEHDIELVMSVCDRIFVMDAGRVIAAGTPAEVRADITVVQAYLGDANAG
jgi:ABC-type branched-subunit amino acid transport system ATPase component